MSEPLIGFIAGQTKPEDWQTYSDRGIYVDVNTYGSFTTTPLYIASIAGDGNHWETTGGSAIYNATPTSFRVYVKWSDSRPLDVAFAIQQKWCINWIAVGW